MRIHRGDYSSLEYPDSENDCEYAIGSMSWFSYVLQIYPFKLLTVGFHEFGHAFMGVCTGAKIESIHLDPNEGGATRMRGGIPFLTLPAGYLGSSFIGAAMVGDEISYASDAEGIYGRLLPLSTFERPK